jgi:hypothetical protein
MSLCKVRPSTSNMAQAVGATLPHWLVLPQGMIRSPGLRSGWREAEQGCAQSWKQRRGASHSEKKVE